MTDPYIGVEAPNDNPDEVSDDGLGIPPPPVIDPADVDEDEPPTDVHDISEHTED